MVKKVRRGVYGGIVPVEGTGEIFLVMAKGWRSRRLGGMS